MSGWSSCGRGSSSTRRLPTCGCTLNFEGPKGVAAHADRPPARRCGAVGGAARRRAAGRQAAARSVAVRVHVPGASGRPRRACFYGTNFTGVRGLPRELVRLANYTDTADTGDDYLCSVCYAVDTDGAVYVTDVVYSREPMEVTEELVAAMLRAAGVRQASVGSNNGGRGFARAVQAGLRACAWSGFIRAAASEARILHSGHGAPQPLRFPRDGSSAGPSSGPPDDLPAQVPREPLARRPRDVLTGIVEREAAATGKRAGCAACGFSGKAQRRNAPSYRLRRGRLLLRGGATLSPRAPGDASVQRLDRRRPASDRCPTGVRPVSGRLFGREAAHRAATVRARRPARRRRRAVRGASVVVPRCGAKAILFAHALDTCRPARRWRRRRRSRFATCPGKAL